MYYTYVLLCINDKTGKKEFYTGFTEDLKRRLSEHRDGKTVSTKNFDSVRVAYYEVCLNKTDARKRELQLKTGFGRGYLKRRLESYLENI